MNTYSFTDVHASLVGPPGFSVNLGFGASVADEGITTEMHNDKSTLMVGADGRGMHSMHADNSGILTVSLLKISPVNAILMAMYDAQSLSSALWGQNIVVVRQVASGDITTVSGAAFKRRPSLKYAKDGDIVQWAFDAIAILSVLGRY